MLALERERYRGRGEVEGDEELLTVELPDEGERSGRRVEEPLGSEPQGRDAPMQREQLSRERERGVGVTLLRLDAQRLRVGDEGQPRFACGEPGARPGLGRPPPRQRRALGISPIHVDDAIGSDHGVRESKLLSLEQERGAAQRDDEHHRDPTPPEVRDRAVRVPARNPPVVVVLEQPRRPRDRRRDPDELLDRRPERIRPPRQSDEHEVVGEVQLLATVDVRGDPRQLVEVHLADEHPLIVLVGDAAQLPEPFVDRRHPVLVMAPRRFVLAELRVLRELEHDVNPEAVDASVHPEAQRVRHRGADRRVVPVELRLLGQERVQVVLTARLVERPWRPDRREVRDPAVRRPSVGRRVAPYVPVTLRARPAAPGLDEPRMLIGRVVRDPVDDDADSAPVRGGKQAIEVLERPELRIDVGVIRHVVPEVGHR